MYNTCTRMMQDLSRNESTAASSCHQVLQPLLTICFQEQKSPWHPWTALVGHCPFRPLFPRLNHSDSQAHRQQFGSTNATRSTGGGMKSRKKKTNKEPTSDLG